MDNLSGLAIFNFRESTLSERKRILEENKNIDNWLDNKNERSFSITDSPDKKPTLGLQKKRIKLLLSENSYFNKSQTYQKYIKKNLILKRNLFNEEFVEKIENADEVKEINFDKECSKAQEVSEDKSDCTKTEEALDHVEPLHSYASHLIQTKIPTRKNSYNDNYECSETEDILKMKDSKDTFLVLGKEREEIESSRPWQIKIEEEISTSIHESSPEKNEEEFLSPKEIHSSLIISLEQELN